LVANNAFCSLLERLPHPTGEPEHWSNEPHHYGRLGGLGGCVDVRIIDHGYVSWIWKHMEVELLKRFRRSYKWSHSKKSHMKRTNGVATNLFGLYMQDFIWLRKFGGHVQPLEPILTCVDSKNTTKRPSIYSHKCSNSQMLIIIVVPTSITHNRYPSAPDTSRMISEQKK
jgi:hypothetical protein